MIFYGKQSVDQSDIDAVVEVLKSDFLTQGPAIEKFEKCVAEYCGVKYAVAVTNATSALHIACLAAGLGKGDVLWTSPITFTASANCGRYCGADVDFVDIDPSTYNMSVDELDKKLQQAEVKPKVVIPVHLAGQSCDMDKIYKLSQEYGFKVIEDASHAIGADYKSAKIGCCKYSDFTVFSFHPVKIVTTGEGMVLTNDKDLHEKLLLYRSHGITRDTKLMTRLADGPWYYQQIDLGFNYRMTDMQAALGYSQMQKVDEFVSRRRYLAKRYNELLKNISNIRLPYQSEDTDSSWHLYVVRVDFSKINKTKQQIFAEMKDRGVCLNLHYIPVHTQPYYQKQGFKDGDFPNSEKYYEEVFTLPLYYSLTDEQQDYIVKNLVEVLQ